MKFFIQKDTCFVRKYDQFANKESIFRQNITKMRQSAKFRENRLTKEVNYSIIKFNIIG